MDRKLKIAINAINLPKNLAGIGYYTYNLVKHISDLTTVENVYLFTNLQASYSFNFTSKKISIIPINVSNIILKTFYSQFILHFKLNNCDLLHSIGNVACLWTSTPQVVTIHDLCHRAVPARFSFLKRAYLEIGITLTLKKKLTLICDSDSTKTDLFNYYKVDSKVNRVHLAIKFQTDSVEIVERSGLLFVGTLEPGKNLELALRALNALKKQGIQETLKIVGAKGWKQTHIYKIVTDLKIQNSVEFCGYINDESLRLAYKHAKCLLFPSIYEGFGFPILEAQSQGCVVISADNSCLREIGGEGALYFKNMDLNDIIKVTQECIQHKSLWLSTQKKGYENCNRFSWTKTALETMENYQYAISSHKAPKKILGN